MHLLQDRLFDQLAVNHHLTGINLDKGLDDAARMGNPPFIEREDLAEARNLLRELNRSLLGHRPRNRQTEGGSQAFDAEDPLHVIPSIPDRR